MKTLMEKVNEYKITLWVAMIDYGKAFDLIEIWAALNALSNARINYRYITTNEVDWDSWGYKDF